MLEYKYQTEKMLEKIQTLENICKNMEENTII